MGAGFKAGGLEILLIEHQELDALVVRKQLVGSVVRWARTAEEGLRALDCTHFDAVLLNIHGRDFEPISTLRSVVDALGGTAPVLVLSAYEDDAVARQWVQRGADDFIAKSELSGQRLEGRICMAIERTRQRRAVISSEERAADWARRGALHWEWDIRSNGARYDDNWKRRFGITGTADTPDTWFELIHPDDQARVSDAVISVVDGEEPGVRIRHRMRMPDGTYRWYSARITTCMSGNLHPVKVLGSHSDISAPPPSTCAVCGKEIPDGAHDCSACGATLTHQPYFGETLASGEIRHGWTGRVVAGRFTIGRNLGAGGAGAVYRATDATSRSTVAVKLLHPWLVDSVEARDRFLREGQTQKALSHENLLRVVAVGESSGVCYIATEFAPDGSLLDLLEVRKKLPAAQALALLIPLVRGVEVAHRAGVVHRDIKPANIMLCRENKRTVAKLTDFGVAKVAPMLSETLTGAIIGTLRYMAPEQFLDAKHVDSRADIYSLAATLYQTLTGHLPPRLDRQNGAIPVRPDLRLRGVPSELATVIASALANDPNRRYSSCHEFADELTGALRHVEASAPARHALTLRLAENSDTDDQRVNPSER